METFRTPSESQGVRSHPSKHQFSITLHTVTTLVWNLSYIYNLLISVSPISLSPMFLPFFISLHPPTPFPQFLSLSKFAKSSSVSLPCFYSPPFLHYFEWDSCENRKCSGLSITSSLYPLPSPLSAPAFKQLSYSVCSTNLIKLIAESCSLTPCFLWPHEASFMGYSGLCRRSLTPSLYPNRNRTDESSESELLWP